jgi:carboxyl-terminal processing protease
VDRAAETEHGLSISGQAVPPSSLEGRPEYRTPSGRIVYGGGGITPDVEVLPEMLSSTEVESVQALLPSFGRISLAIFNFSVDYVRQDPSLAPGFSLSEGDMERLYASLPDFGAQVGREEFEGAKRFVRYQLEREIASQAWGQSGEFLQSSSYDRQLQAAVDLLRGVESTEELLREVGTTAVGSARR